MTTICCHDIQGNAITVPAETVIFRPAVYGILLDNNQILLIRHPQTGLLHPPGCMLTARDTPIGALRNHFRRITGMVPTIGPLLFVEDRYLVDEKGEAWQLSALYYAVDRSAQSPTAFVELMGEAKPELVQLDKLGRSQMQFGYEAIEAGRLRMTL